MSTATKNRRLLRIVFIVMGVSTVVGAGYGYLVGETIGVARGVVVSLAISGLVAGFEVGYVEQESGRWIKTLPFATMILLKSVIYLVAFAAGGLLGTTLVPVPGETVQPWIGMSNRDIAFSYATSFLITAAIAVSRLVGPGVLWRFLTGRYHRPREEERIFLFLDLKGSTAIAAEHGNVAFLTLLDRCYFDLGPVVMGHGGEIHKYVGDEMIVTWPMADGLRAAACVRCAAAALDTIRNAGPTYRDRFGVAPLFRAALHGGTAVSGEIGDLKREIVYLGDALNVTARLEQAAKAIDADLVVSDALLSRLSLPANMTAVALDAVAAKGIELPLRLHRLDWTPESNI